MALEEIKTTPTLPARPRDSHKGRFGTILVLAGSRGMAGPPPVRGLGL